MIYIISTPIGNLKDITLRALEILKEVDLILCEDTRVTRKLLDHYEIKTPTDSYHHHTPEKKVREIMARLKSGVKLALVTDAGTPGIADPGNKLISTLIKEGLASLITPVPGPSALTAALSICGFATDNFAFYGFPPSKNKRALFWQKIAATPSVVIFFDSPYHIIKSLTELAKVVKDRQVMVARELTKKFETIYRGSAAEILNKLTPGEQRGEFVVVVSK